MRLRTTLGLIAGLAITMTACSGIKANSIFDTEYAFGGSATYIWAEQAPPVVNGRANDLLHRRIVSSVDRELSAKGMRLDANATYRIVYYVGVERIPRVTTSGYYGGGWRRWGRGWGVDVGTSTTRVSHYNEASLTLDVLDSRTDALVWRGTVKGTVNPGDSMEKRNSKLTEAVSKMLEGFPPDGQVE